MTKKTMMGLAAFALMTGISSAAVYTWNGSANDGNWANTANWAGGKAPTTLSAAPVDNLYFKGANMPTSNIPSYETGYAVNSARMFFNRGGTFNLDLSTSQNASFITLVGSTILTVGDGSTGASENVVVNVSNMKFLLRHSNVTANFLVNKDGVLNFSGGLDLFNDSKKNATITINGGSVMANGEVDAQFKDQAKSYIDFKAPGSSFTAAYGGACPNFAAVKSNAGGTFRNSAGGTLTFSDNGRTFTVTTTP